VRGFFNPNKERIVTVSTKKTKKTKKTKNGLIEPPGVFFYYVRDRSGNPFACVALADNGEEGCWGRGVSICSNQDQFTKERARKLAYGRLCKAFGTSDTSDKVTTRADFQFYCPGVEHKVGYDIMLTAYEKQVVEPNK
jgi:hypothetical protein